MSLLKMPDIVDGMWVWARAWFGCACDLDVTFGILFESRLGIWK